MPSKIRKLTCLRSTKPKKTKSKSNPIFTYDARRLRATAIRPRSDPSPVCALPPVLARASSPGRCTGASRSRVEKRAQSRRNRFDFRSKPRTHRIIIHYHPPVTHCVRPGTSQCSSTSPSSPVSLGRVTPACNATSRVGPRAVGRARRRPRSSITARIARPISSSRSASATRLKPSRGAVEASGTVRGGEPSCTTGRRE